MNTNGHKSSLPRMSAAACCLVTQSSRKVFSKLATLNRQTNLNLMPSWRSYRMPSGPANPSVVRHLCVFQTFFRQYAARKINAMLVNLNFKFYSHTTSGWGGCCRFGESNLGLPHMVAQGYRCLF